MYSFPCKNCPDRAVGCHSTCEKYLAAQREHTKQRAEMFKIKSAQDSLDEYRFRVIAGIRERYEKRR